MVCWKDGGLHAFTTGWGFSENLWWSGLGGGDHVLCTYRFYPHVVIDIPRPEKAQGHRQCEFREREA